MSRSVCSEFKFYSDIQETFNLALSSTNQNHILTYCFCLYLVNFFERLELLKLDDKSGFKDDFPPKDKYPKLNAYYSRMKMQPEVKIAARPLDQHVAFMKGHLAGEPNYDIGI